MFGKNLEKFLKYEIYYDVDYTQDIYYSIKKDVFWVHIYFGTETIETDDILLSSIEQHYNQKLNCVYCSHDEPSKICKYINSCATELVYEEIIDNALNGSNALYQQIADIALQNIDVYELIDVNYILSKELEPYFPEKWNINLENILDYIIEGIVNYGFDICNNQILEPFIAQLIMNYEHIKNDEVQECLQLLDNYKIIEALQRLRTEKQ